MNNKPPAQRHSSSASQKPVLLYSRRPFRNKLFLVIGFVLGLAMLLAALWLAEVAHSAPGSDELRQARAAQVSVVLSARGKVLTTFRRAWQEKVTLEQISPWIVQALIATEDHRFYEHRGVDYQRTLQALFRTARGDAQGGSTITQQLARNLFPEKIGRSRTVDRKLREIITALKIENSLSKREILETYLNTVPFLYNVVGIEMAARTYYGKPASELDLNESATLVGMLKGTSYYNPVLNPERAQKRRNVVLAQMVKRGIISDSKYQRLRAEPLGVRLNRPKEPPSSAPHFVAHVRQWLLKWAEQNGRNLYTDGMIIHTTLDDAMQQAATEAVTRQTELLQNIVDVEWAHHSGQFLSESPSAYTFLRSRIEPFRQFWRDNPELETAFIRESPQYRQAVADGKKSDAAALDELRSDRKFMQALRNSKTRLEAGFLAIDPVNAEIRAWVGSRDFMLDQYDHVARAERQPGSTFKPFVYAAALEQGLGPDTLYRDIEVEIVAPDGDIWRPTDITAASGRTMPMREGLVHSKNTITAQVMLDVGLSNVVRLARDSGIIQSELQEVPSLALGTSPVTLLEMVSAYSTFAQKGEYREPVFVRRITDRHGRVLAEFGGRSYRALSEQTALQLIDMMRGVVQHGTGTALLTRFGIHADIAGKSGTTQHNTDGWFILMHPNLVAGAWVGFNDQRVRIRGDYWGQGGHNALLLVGDFFRQMLRTGMISRKERFPKPARHFAGVLAAKTMPEPETGPDLLNEISGAAGHAQPAAVEENASGGSGW